MEYIQNPPVRFEEVGEGDVTKVVITYNFCLRLNVRGDLRSPCIHGYISGYSGYLDILTTVFYI